MLTLEKVIAIIRNNQLPCWKLSSKQSYKRPVPIGNYFPLKKGKDISDDEDYAEKELEAMLDGSVAQLENTLKHYKEIPGVTFEIIICKSKNSNGSANTIGPLEFNLADSIAGVGSSPALDYLGHEKMLDKRMEVERLFHSVDSDRIQFNYEKLREWDKIEAARAELKKKEEEVEKLRLKYEDHSERVKHGATKAAISLFEKLVPKESEKGIGAVETKVEETPPTPQEKLIEGLAKEIHEKVTDETEIKVIGAMVMKFISNPQDEIFQKFRTNLSVVK